MTEPFYSGGRWIYRVKRDDGAEKILPSDQGVFLTNTNVLFKAYYINDDCLGGSE